MLTGEDLVMEEDFTSCSCRDLGASYAYNFDPDRPEWGRKSVEVTYNEIVGRSRFSLQEIEVFELAT